jgi:hypothetical protein
MLMPLLITQNNWAMIRQLLQIGRIEVQSFRKLAHFAPGAP